ncbi:DUF4212 domain-containing protein [Cupriavidus basilensis]|uniref:DUF4212 domain-containing protein n=1 Tax=Cupriavidus basilensis TaxID=68895 RepID=A0ABT6AHR4_9BURK|nr:DUF4212 domain-containing protein [Cupriavidus basilensis]MDF3832147.1 DUF4212 domain-containing protein [Cupriavidus basilensis]
MSAPGQPDADHIRAARDQADGSERRAWQRNLRWIAVLLSLWFIVTFVVAWFARELRFDFFGWPFSFWVGAQGALILYVLMAALYAWRMNLADDDQADNPLPPAVPRQHDHDAA